MSKANNYDGLRPAQPSDIVVGARVWYKPHSSSFRAGWCTITQVSERGGVEIKGIDKGIPSLHLHYLWVKRDTLWVLKDRVMFRVFKKTGEVIVVMLDSIREQYGVEGVRVYARGGMGSGELPYQSLIGKTRGLQTTLEQNKAQVLLQQLEAETKTTYRIKKRR